METVAEYAHVKRAELETEIRQLRATVYALREELELASVELKHKIQDVRSSYEAEMVQLRNTIGSMRQAIETGAVEAEHAATLAVAAVREENKALRDTIQQMRGVNEQQRNAHLTEKQKLQNIANDEITQLKTVIQLLRDEIDGMKIRYEQGVQAAERARRAECAELQETIGVLRAELERHGGR